MSRPVPTGDLLKDIAKQVEGLKASVGGLKGAGAKKAQDGIDVVQAELLRLRETIGAQHSPDKAILDGLADGVARLFSVVPTLTGPASRRTRDGLTRIVGDIARICEALDPIREPEDVFDPTRPDAAGTLVALALIEQPQLELDRVGRMYGSGVYAIYYHGDHPAYAPISGSETPIYVGKADPSNPHAKTAREQGPRLSGRLLDHRKQVRTVHAYATANPHTDNPVLRIEDFKYRRLVVATNSQLVAERHLISIFRPAWNSDTKICWGISKHGDAATTRANDRSPWDVLHPGRSWAADSPGEQMSRDEILSKLSKHFIEHPPFKDRGAIMDQLLGGFRQTAVELRAEGAPDDEETTSTDESE